MKFPLLTAVVFVTVFWSAVCRPVAAVPLDVPEELRAWRGWVLNGHEQAQCPCFYNQPDPTVCAWPARLALDFTDQGGAFTQKWTLYRESFVPLPGGEQLWPGDVTVDGVPLPVVLSGVSPAVRLEAGTHEIRGRFFWTRMPEIVQIPEICGLVSLTVNHVLKDPVYTDRDNNLYVRKSDRDDQAKDSLDISVFRLIDDQIPLRLTTRFKMNVSGRSRDVRLEEVLPADFLILSIQSALPVNINPDGSLTVRVRAGRYEIDMAARSEKPVARIPLETARYGNEIWCFAARNHLRMVRIAGVTPVDPAQTDLPEEWKRYSAFTVRPGDVFSFNEIKRGNPDPPPNALDLNRVLWLDFSGNGWTAKDEITGTRTRERVFTMRSPFELGRATVNGEDRLITAHGADNRPGIEILNKTVNITAESRIESRTRRMPGSGWDIDFQTVKAAVNLPAGYRLLAVSGTDRASGTWLGRWTLLDFFILLMIAVAVFKLWGMGAGALSLLTLGLCFHEPGAPTYIWISVLSAAALLRVLPNNRFRTVISAVYAVSAVILVCVSVMFMARQVRVAAFPQLERHSGRPAGQWADSVSRKSDLSRSVQEMTADAVKMPLPAPAPMPVKRPGYGGRTDGLYAVQQESGLQWSDPDALNQTGPGLPLWQWKTHHLSWTGPVNADEMIRFWLLPPAVNSGIGFLRVIMLSVLLAVVIRVRSLFRRTYARYFGVAAACLLAGWGVLASQPVMAEGFPPQHLLDEYRQILIEKPDCLPHCADIPFLSVQAQEDRIAFAYDIHADTRTAVPLPQVGSGTVPGTVTLDDAPAAGLYKDRNNIRYLLIEKGIHRVRMETVVRDLDETNVFFPLLPRRAVFDSADWRIQGIDSDGRIKSGIRLVRQSLANSPDDQAKNGTGSHADDFFILETVISLGLDWRIHHQLTRMSDKGTSAVLQVPLLRGESILSGRIDTRDGTALVTMDAGQTQAAWESALEKTEQIVLAASQSSEYAEKWYLKSSPVWHVEFTGIPLIHSLDENGEYTPHWQPWPGESLTISVSRPEAVKGNILTIDRCRVAFRPGKRLSHASMNLRIRSSKGGQQSLNIPDNAVLQKVTVSNRELPVTLSGGTVTLPLEPGLQPVSIEWTQPVDRFIVLSMPDISLNQTAVNVDARMTLPYGRWILWTGGPRLGPAVLFWSYLIVIAAAALFLGRIKTVPVSRGGWFLLGIGLTQAPVFISAVIVFWFLALKWRGTHRLPDNAWLFNLMQTGLAGLTFLALGGLFAAVSAGLLGVPDMQITGNGSDGTTLFWTMDRISGKMPPIRVISLPLPVFKLLMLMWSLWMAFSLVKWLKWGWTSFSRDGLWKKLPRLIKRPGKKGPPPLKDTE